MNVITFFSLPQRDSLCLQVFSVTASSSHLQPVLWQKCLSWARTGGRPDGAGRRRTTAGPGSSDTSWRTTASTWKCKMSVREMCLKIAPQQSQRLRHRIRFFVRDQHLPFVHNKKKMLAITSSRPIFKGLT